MQYLHSPSGRATATDVFGIPGKEAIKKFIRRLVDRLDDSEKSTAGATTSVKDTAARYFLQMLYKFCQNFSLKMHKLNVITVVNIVAYSSVTSFS